MASSGSPGPGAGLVVEVTAVGLGHVGVRAREGDDGVAERCAVVAAADVAAHLREPASRAALGARVRPGERDAAQACERGEVPREVACIVAVGALEIRSALAVAELA